MSLREQVAVDGILLPEAMYTTEGVWKATGLGRVSLAEARQKKLLEAIAVGNRIFYRGRDLIRLIESHSKRDE